MAGITNFKRPEGEEPYYYSSTVVDGQVVRHDGDPEHAVYRSEMAEITRRANLWHKWVEANVPNAYNSWGVIDPEVMAKYSNVNRQFMDGEREN